jgi:hypothetical protein
MRDPMSYVVAAYLIVLGSVVAYALQRAREIRRLRRALGGSAASNRG